MSPIDFDTLVDRRGTRCEKWDLMESTFGVTATDGLPMWVADMDFRSPQAVQAAVGNLARHGVYGYYGDDGPYKAAIAWWMQARWIS